jgi:hypothetical protein
MPDDPADPCPPDVENNTPEAPAQRPGPLQHSETADAGCLILLGVAFIGVFLLPAVLLLGGAVVGVAMIAFFLLVIATPFFNPMERAAPRAKWWGRAITFLVLAGILVAAWFWINSLGEQAARDDDY